ncbi:hypothetical protein [Photobacterium sp. R1]
MDTTSLLNTSVSDAEISLNHELRTNPKNAKKIALEIIEHLTGRTDNKSRKALAEKIIRQADKILKRDGV